MSFPLILLFSSSLIFTWIILQLIGKSYALDHPNSRKSHDSKIPQIGGITLGPIFLLICWWLGLAPVWYLVSGLISILLGTVDDFIPVPWQVKIIVQLALAAYIGNIFWGSFDNVTFYNLSFSLSQVELFVIFIFWFIGIYNAVNLLDGLDGLAGGFMLILSIGLGLSGSAAFAQLNIIFSTILLSFLVFNQRPAKLFMGDAGSLFLGFHTAVLPLLFVESTSAIKTLNMTPFVLLTSYLIADTARVFFTRIAARKSPMTADTIHFHHVILKQSSSYLASIGSIYFITLISAIVMVLSFHTELSVNVMLAHLALLLFFILTPPIQTYVPFITRTVKPLYTWQKDHQATYPFLPRTLFMVILLIGLIFSFCFYYNLDFHINWQYGFPIFLLIICLLSKEKMAMYAFNIGIVLLFTEIYWNTELNTYTKLFSIFIIVSIIIFTVEKRIGCDFRKFSSLDLLMIIITLGGICLFLLNFPIPFWFLLALFSLWFSTSFILRRTIYFMPSTS